MLSWKDAITEKLAHIFSSSSPPASPRPQPHQARWSSILSLFLGSDESASKQDNDVNAIQPRPERQNAKTVSWEDRPKEGGGDGACEPRRLKSKRCEPTLVPTAREETGDQGSGRSTSSPEVFEDATAVNTPMKPLPDLAPDSLFITSELYQFLNSCLPNIVKGCRWALLYSTVKHGISLRTLIRKSSDLSGLCLLITGDTKGAVFGGLLNCPLTPTSKRKYQGTYQTFVFTTFYGAPTLFRPTGANRYFYICLNDLLALGGGGNFALSLDGDLLTGTSGPCDTFGNQCLAHNQEFELKDVELWGFTHLSISNF